MLHFEAILCYLTCSYGSASAQKRDWKRGHKRECTALIACAPDHEVPPASVRLAARILWSLPPLSLTATTGDGGQASDSDTVVALRNLVCHWDMFAPQRKVALAQTAVVTRCVV